MCDDRCGIDVHVEDGRVARVAGSREHVHSQGRLCAKARQITEMVHHPDRLTTPLHRVGAEWEEVGLEEALDAIAERLEHVSRRHGRRSIGVWKGEAVGFGQQEGLARRFAHAIGTPNYLSNDSMCFNARYLGYRFVEGGVPLPDYEHARCILLWGTNPPATLPNVAAAIATARKKGSAVVVVDPRRTKAAHLATLHVGVRPGTDGALAWALINELIMGGIADIQAARERCVGFDEAAQYARAFTPEWVETETGVPAGTVREIAALLARAAPAVAIYPGNGLEHHENGVDTIRTIAMLDALLGSLGATGGQRFLEQPPLRDLTLYREVPLEHLEPIGADRFPALYRERHECHTMTAIGAMLDSTPYALRALVLTAGNPALTNPDSRRVRAAFSSLDLLVVRELFMTETAKLADYVLPAASFLERSELHLYPEEQALALSQRVFTLPGVQTEYEFWRDLARRLDAGDFFPWEDERALNCWLLEPSGLPLEELEARREGVRFTPPEKTGAEVPIDTPSGKVEFVSEQLAALGYDALPRYRRPGYLREPDPGRPFVLITGARKARLVHSRFHGLSQVERSGLRPEVELHPQDAEALGIEDGDGVRLSSGTGQVDVAVHIVDPADIVRGVVQLTHGWTEANANLLTPDDCCDPISGFPAVKEVPVAIVKAPVLL
jgi:anaerobic selenocysteine-containing dehydrogenase